MGITAVLLAFPVIETQQNPLGAYCSCLCCSGRHHPFHSEAYMGKQQGASASQAFRHIASGAAKQQSPLASAALADMDGDNMRVAALQLIQRRPTYGAA